MHARNLDPILNLNLHLRYRSFECMRADGWALRVASRAIFVNGEPTDAETDGHVAGPLKLEPEAQLNAVNLRVSRPMRY